MKIFEKHFGREMLPEEPEAIGRALAAVDPRDLDAACLRAFQECQYYPHVADILTRVEPTHSKFAGVTILRPTSKGLCYKGSSVDGGISVEYLRYGEKVKRTMHCGCEVCDADGYGAWLLDSQKRVGV